MIKEGGCGRLGNYPDPIMREAALLSETSETEDAAPHVP
jgi:hypothetical protein